MHRRDFVRTAFVLGGLAGAEALFPELLKAVTKPKTLLIIGGTSFLGPALVEAAQIAGHEVTLFNRGLTNVEWFPHLEKLRGLRDSNPQQQNLQALKGRRWDAIVDVWPFDPDVVGTCAEFLKDQTDHYFYVSSCSAYEDKPLSPPPQPKEAEDWPTCVFEPAATGWRKYAVGKAESERRVHAAFGARCTIARPGVIKGYRDAVAWADDLWFYAVRIQRGGNLIAPGTGDDSFQLIDVRDVARFMVKCIDEQLYGVFNVAGEPQTFRDFHDLCKRVTLSDAELVWIPQAFLHARGLEPRKNFPFWSPNPDHKPYGDTDYSKAKRAGLQFRHPEEMVRESLQWFAECSPREPVVNNFGVTELGGQIQWKYLSQAKEAEVLAAWKNHAS
jgi:2'-hydroxyisoflavone reductase